MNNKKILYVIVIFITLFIYNVNVYATDSTDTIITGADDFLSKGNGSILNLNAVKNVSNIMFNTFIAIGTIIVLIIGAVLGIKFMIGSIEEKAEIKESIKPYIGGAIVIFASIAIWSISVKILQDVF